MTNEAIKQFHHFQNQHTQAAYLYIVANRFVLYRVGIWYYIFIFRWFWIRIDMIISLFIGISFILCPFLCHHVIYSFIVCITT